MKNLENRTYDSRREMDILDALEEVRHLNKRLAKVNFDELILKTLSKYEDQEEKVKDEAIKEYYNKSLQNIKCKRLSDDEPYEDADNFDSHIGF